MALTQPGYGSGASVRIVVKNTSSATILKGYGVEMNLASYLVDTPLGDLAAGENEKAIGVEASAVESAQILGVATTDIGAGQYGEIVVHGMVQVYADAAITTNTTIGCETTAGQWDDAATAKMALALEAATAAGELIWAYFFGFNRAPAVIS